MFYNQNILFKKLKNFLIKEFIFKTFFKKLLQVQLQVPPIFWRRYFF